MTNRQGIVFTFFSPREGCNPPFWRMLGSLSLRPVRIFYVGRLDAPHPILVGQMGYYRHNAVLRLALRFLDQMQVAA